MNATWPVAALEDLCDRITVGHVGPMADEYVGEGIPFLRSQNILPFRISTDGLKFISQRFHERLRKSALHAGDVVVVRTGYPGTAAVIPESLADSNCADLVIITPGPDLDADFLAAVFNSTWGIGSVAGALVGAAQQHFNVGAARRLQIHLPPRRTQEKIAAIVTAYGDLMANYSRRIRVLEEIAHRIFNEWFVEFRFPGHATVPLVEAELGPSPKGWEVLPLSSLVSTQYGYTETASSEPIGPQFLRGTDINKTSYVDWSTVPFCRISESELPKYRLLPGDVVVIRMADPGKVGIVEKDVDAVFASYLIRLKPIERHLVPYFLFYLLSSDRYQALVTGASTGTTRKSLSAPVMTSMRVAAPPVELQMAFSEVVSPIRRLVTSLLQANANLRSTRNLLLPRLVAGEIDVTVLDITMPPAAA